ncbi:hypothetical protein GCM10010472_18800 [Pseudonocardia halophobica]|uniref:Uncharacterized protein n=1 Tax=Pseudonocardia halophobica TaxID=29401 RepID=A0A9W6L0F8_9PSEU|nr:hypothetical protein [Pseudonocardia halophobica]GLL09906.1 hypothetical protein GCM10017577_10460 [Pseudonocardia halophobica]
MRVAFTAQEHALVAEAALHAGVAVGAWLGEQALRAAAPDGVPDSLRGVVAELLRLRLELIAAAELVDRGELTRLTDRLDELLDLLVTAAGRVR